MATYLQAPGYGELLFEINGWDPAGLAAFRASPVVKSIPGGIDSVATPEQLRAIRELMPADGCPRPTAHPNSARAASSISSRPAPTA